MEGVVRVSRDTAFVVSEDEVKQRGQWNGAVAFVRVIERPQHHTLHQGADSDQDIKGDGFSIHGEADIKIRLSSFADQVGIPYELHCSDSRVSGQGSFDTEYDIVVWILMLGVKQ